MKRKGNERSGGRETRNRRVHYMLCSVTAFPLFPLEDTFPREDLFATIFSLVSRFSFYSQRTFDEQFLSFLFLVFSFSFFNES